MVIKAWGWWNRGDAVRCNTNFHLQDNAQHSYYSQHYFIVCRVVKRLDVTCSCHKKEIIIMCSDRSVSWHYGGYCIVTYNCIWHIFTSYSKKKKIIIIKAPKMGNKTGSNYSCFLLKVNMYGENIAFSE